MLWDILPFSFESLHVAYLSTVFITDSEVLNLVRAHYQTFLWWLNFCTTSLCPYPAPQVVGIKPQGLVHTRQKIYHWATPPTPNYPFMPFWFSKIFLISFLSQQSSTAWTHFFRAFKSSFNFMGKLKEAFILLRSSFLHIQILTKACLNLT